MARCGFDTRGLVAGLLALWLAGCSAPGTRATGTAEARWQGQPPVRWTGPCRYVVRTRWNTSLPHAIELEADDADWSIRISGRRLPRTSASLEPPGEGEGHHLGLVMQGAGVIGSIRGTFRVSARSDSLFVDVSGHKVYRDTVPLSASCRMGPIPAP